MNHDLPETAHTHPPNQVRVVLLVGHCGFDESSLARAVAGALPDIDILSAAGRQDLDQHANPGSLWLINRVLDGRFKARSGVELIALYAQNEQGPRMMLISNYADAQADAVQVGALPGFGKQALRSPETVDKLKAAAGSSHQ